MPFMIALRFAVVSVLVAAGSGVLGWLGQRGGPVARLRAGTPVVVEIFSSEGCSSCPPADAYGRMLDRTQPIDGASIVVLEEHVDYWDGLGWKDPFAKAAFGERQRQYAARLDGSRVYTPEIVVDGRFVVGSGDDSGSRGRIAQSAGEARAKVTLRRIGARLGIDVTDVPLAAGEVADVWLALTERNLVTEVQRGENGGRTLAHAPVVRALRMIGRTEGGALHTTTTLESDPTWNAGGVRAVVFVQRPGGGAIIGAGVLSSEP